MAVNVFPQASSKIQPKQQIFESSGSFTVPAGVTSLEVTAVGGGASGYYSGNWFPGGGGAVVKSMISCTPGEVIPFTIGAGGTGGGSTGGDGGNTTIKTIFAGGGKKNTYAGDFSLDLTNSNKYNIPLATYQDTTNRGEYYWTGKKIYGDTSLSFSGHFSGYTNSNRPIIIWDPATMANPCETYRGWETGNDNGVYYCHIVRFKNNLVIFRYNSNPAVAGQNQVGSIQYLPLSSVQSGASATWTNATMPAGITMHSTDLRISFGNSVFMDSNYLYFGTKSNGVIRTADGITWENVISWSAGSGTASGFGNSGYGYLWVDNLGRINFYNANQSYGGTMYITDTAKTAWTSLGGISTGYTYGMQYGGQYQYAMTGAYDPVDDIFRAYHHVSQSNSAQSINGQNQMQWIKVSAANALTSGSSTINWNSSFGVNTDLTQALGQEWITPKKLLVTWGGFVGMYDMTNASNAQNNYTEIDIRNTSVTQLYASITAFNPTNRRFYVARNYVATPYYNWAGTVGGGTKGRAGSPSSSSTAAVGGSAGGPWVSTASSYNIPGPGIDGYGQGGGNNTGGSLYSSTTEIPYGTGVMNASNSYHPGGPGLIVLRWWE